MVAKKVVEMLQKPCQNVTFSDVTLSNIWQLFWTVLAPFARQKEIELETCLRLNFTFFSWLLTKPFRYPELSICIQQNYMVPVKVGRIKVHLHGLPSCLTSLIRSKQLALAACSNLGEKLHVRDGVCQWLGTLSEHAFNNLL